ERREGGGVGRGELFPGGGSRRVALALRANGSDDANRLGQRPVRCRAGQADAEPGGEETQHDWLQVHRSAQKLPRSTSRNRRAQSFMSLTARRLSPRTAAVF